MDRRAQSRILLVSLVLVAALALGFVFAGSTAAQTADITVDAGGSTNYTSIQAAVDNATAGEVIAVQNGTYRESVTINKSITLVAGPGNVVLNGSTLSSDADAFNITTNSTIQPKIDGFQITGYADGIDARDAAGDWTAGNLTITDTTFGVSAFNSSGNWNVRNVSITDGSMGIDASESTGSWNVTASTVRNASNAGLAAEAQDGLGNGTVFRTTVTDSNAGVVLYGSDMNVAIIESTLANNSIGINAKSTTGTWRVEESTIQDNAEGLNATGAAIDGDAAYNYWGAADGPSGVFDGSGDAVFGEVDISPYYTDETFTETAGVQPDADPVINETVSSVTPATVTTNETEAYVVNVTVENTTLTDESGEVDVGFENFTLDTFEDDLTINYTAGNISNGTLSVIGSVNATAPNTTGTYAVNLTEIRVEGPGEGPIENGNLTIDTIEVGSAADPVVNETASSVTPTNVTANESRTYTVNVTIDNTTLTDAEGDVNVEFKNFSLDIDDDSLDGPEEDLKINYTAANLTDGTLSVSTTVSGTAPTTAGTYPINVTDLEVYTADGDEMLIQDANVTIESIDVSPLVSETLVVNATDGIGDYDTIQSAVDAATNGTTVLVEDGTYSEEVTIAENISLVAESDKVVLNGSTIDGTDGISITDDVAGVFIDGLTVTEYSGYGINASGTDATWSLLNGTIQNVSRGVYAFESSGDWTVENTTIADVDDMGIDAAKSSGEWHIESTTITNASSVGVSTELTTKRGSVTNSTVTNSNVGIGITGNVSVWYSTVADNDVGISAWETTEEWTVRESRIQNNTEGIEVTNATVAGNATYNYWGADDGPSGDFDGSGDPAVGNVSVSPFYSDEALTTLDEPSEMADPSINTTASSVIPSTATANETEEYTVNVTIDNTTLSDAEGDVNVVFENFSLNIDDDSLDGPEEDLKINYTAANLTDGTLSVSTTVSGTAPTTAGTYPINVTDLEVYTADGDEMLIEDANETIETIDVTEPTTSETVDIQYALTSAGTVFSTEEPRLTSEDLDIATVDGTNFTLNGSRSFRIISATTGESVTVALNDSTATYNVSGLQFDIYNPDGGIGFEPKFETEVDGSFTLIDASVEGDREMFRNESPFGAYSVELLDDSNTVLGSTGTATHGVGYNGSLVQNSTSGTVGVTLNRSPAVNDSWTVTYVVRNETSTVLTEPVTNSDTDDVFTATFDASTIPNGTYAHRFTITPSPDAALGERIIRVSDDSLTVGDSDSDSGGGGSGGAPVINTTASSVVPTATTVNETEPYTVDVVIDNTSLTDQHGEVDVAFENFTLETLEDDLTINYTGTDIDNGTLDITESINATAPDAAGTYTVNVTNIRVENTSDELTFETNNTVGSIEVDEPADPVINETESSVTPTNVTANETEAYTVNVTIDNTTLTDESGQVDVGFENFILEPTDDELQINYTADNITEGTLSVTGSVNATAPALAGTYAVNVTEVWVDGPDEGPVEDANLTIDTIEVGEAAEPVVNETVSSVTPQNVTANQTETYTVNVTIDNTTLTDAEGDVNVEFENFSLDIDDDSLEGPEEDLKINYTAANLTDGTLSVSTTVSGRAPTTAGSYPINVTDLEVYGTGAGDELLIEDANVTVATITVADSTETLDLSLDEPTIPNGTATNLTAAATLTDGTTEDVSTAATLTSSDETVATVDNATGVVSAVGQGTALLNASYDGVNATTEVTVGPAEPTSLDVTLGQEIIRSDAETSVTVDAQLTNGSTQDVTSLAALDSSDGTVVTADNATGTVTGQGAGSATVTASYAGVTASAPIDVTVPPLSVNRTSIDFGNVTLVNNSVAQLNVTNNASTPITVESATLAGPDTDQFAIDAAAITGEIPAETNRTVEVAFTPFTRTTSNATLTLTASEPALSPANVSLGGIGTATNLTLTTNRSSIVAGDPVRFTVTDDDGTPINATIRLPDATAQTGADGNATVRIETVGELTVAATRGSNVTAYAPDSVPITVVAPTLSVADTSLNFGETSLDTAGRANLTLVNDNATSVEVGAVDLFGTNTSQFSLDTSTVPASVAANAERNVSVRYEPFVRGSATASVDVAGETVSLSGTGVAPRPNITAGLPIEITAQQGGSANTTLQITNDGNAPLNATLSSDTDAFNHPSELDIADDATGSVEIQFAPDSGDTGTLTTELVIDADSPALSEFRLTAAGTVQERSVSLRRSEIDFGAVTVGSPATSTVTVDNTGTTTETLSVTTTNRTLFNLSDPADETIELAPGTSERLPIEANLSSSDAATEALLIQNDTFPSVNSTATLNATGQAPTLSVAINEPVAFDDTPINSTSTAEIQLDNNGTAPLAVNLTEAFTGTELANFSVVGESVFEVTAGDSRAVTVGFRPETAGNATANLTLDTNDITATPTEENVTLEAAGFEANLSISGTTSTFGTVGVGGTTTQTLTVENDGASDLTLSETATDDFAVTEAPTSIASGTSGEITVQFAPAANGTQTGTLTVTGTPDNGAPTTVSTPLVGTGRYAELQINQGTLRTGVTTTDSTTTGSVTVENVGLAGTQLSIDDISISGGSFSLDTSGLTAGDTLGSGTNDALRVRFDPASNADNGEQTGTLTLTASSADGAKTITRTLGLTGIVSTPEPTVSTDQLSVGTVTVGDQELRTVTVSNDGGEPFEITGTSTTDDGVTADRIGPSRIVPGGESTVVVIVNQSAPGSFDTDLTVSTDDDTDPSVSVAGQAVAPELSVSTATVAFGDTPVGSAGQAAVTIRNTGNATLAVAQPTITGSGAGEFGLLSGDRPLRIGPDSSQTVSVGFSPSDTGLSEASLELEPLNEPDGSTRTISLNGTGTDAAAELNQSAVGFGDVERGQTVNRTLTLTNDGNAPLEVTGSASILGTDSDAFSVSGLGTPTISPGANETFEIELDTAGRSRGSLSSRVVIPTDDADVTSYLGATVVAPDIDAPGTVAADSFGTTRLGTTSTAEVLVNNTGNAELNLTDLSVTGTDAAAFSVVETPDNTTVEAQDTGRIVVEFAPSALDSAATRAQNQPLSAAATLNVSSDDPDAGEQFVEVGLNGEAVTPSLSVPRTFQFGDVPIGQTTTGELTVENTPSATAALNITDLEVSGADDGDYTASLGGASTPASLAPGESVTVQVNLTPSSFGQKYATLSVATDDSRETVRKVGLSNTETVYSVSYGSINVEYINPTAGTEPTVNVDRGFRGRNATLRSVNSNVSTTEDYSLNYTFGDDPTAIGHDEALTDSDAEGNVTAVQYINATTSAAEGDFTDSTFQTEVSKATLARGNVDPGNVTIYHENGNSYDALDTELLYETTRGYVYEVTTDSYSVFAVGHPETQTTEQTDETDDDTTDDSTDDSTDTTDDGSTGGGGGGGATTDDQQDETPIADIVQDVADLTPETESESEITDSDPDRAGVTVAPADTESVSAITFADETVSGTVSVREYQPDADLTTQIESSVNADLDAAAGATDSSDGGDAGDAADGSTASNVRLVSVTDISPSSDQATASAATVELTVERDDLDEPTNAFVVHETADGWERLETTVEETDGGTVSLSAETDSFSLFAVVENQPDAATDDGGQQPETESSTTDGGDGDTGDSGGSSPLLLVVGILAALAVLGAVLAVVRRE